MASEDQSLAVQFRGYANRIVMKYSKIFNLSADVREELLAVAYLALVEAADRYDPGLGVPFLPYASYRVKGAVLRELNCSKGWRGRDHERVRLKLQLAYNAIRDADAGQTDLEGVLNAAANVAISFGLFVAGPEGDVSEAIVDTNAESPEEVAESNEFKARLRKALRALPEREQFILQCYYYQDMTFEEIARALQKNGLSDGDQPVSKSWVSRIHGRALERMKKKLVR
jgi:RNA polymerase sigma factor for flagellar operon FliA